MRTDAHAAHERLQSLLRERIVEHRSAVEYTVRRRKAADASYRTPAWIARMEKRFERRRRLAKQAPGLKRFRGMPPVDSATIERARAMENTGMTRGAVAKALGVSTKVLWERLGRKWGKGKRALARRVRALLP